jgi:ATP-binding cassette, subfamily B, bacterial
MKHVAALIRFTGPYFWTCTAAGTVLFCVLPATLGLAAQAFFESFTGDAGVGVWTAIAVLAALQASEVLTELAVSHSWSGFSYQSHTLVQRNLLAGILEGYGRHGLPVSPGDAISRFRDEPPNITSGSMDGICDLIGRGIFGVVAVVVMARIDPLLAGAAFFPIVVGAAASDALGTRDARYGAAARDATSRLTGFLGEIVGAQLAVRVAGAGTHVVAHLDEIGERRRRLSLRDRVFAETVNSMNFHLVHVGTGAVLLLGAGRIRSGSFTVGELALFVVYLDQLTYLPAEIGRVITELKRTAVSIHRMHELMPGEPDTAVVAPAPIHVRGPVPPAPAPPARVPLERLDVVGLTALHPSTGRGIEEASFTIERGSVTVLTGRIGAGKSTLLHAVLGLLPAAAGEVRWNGRAIDPATFLVPPHAAFTPQVPRLFSASLLDNLLLGLDLGEVDVDRALRAGVLEDDLAALPAGLATAVGPRGVRLSGGQIQRVAATRMFVRRPELLVFDDLSSALDATTEAELWARLFGGEAITALVVSHSPVALAHADRVVVVEDGRLLDP